MAATHVRGLHMFAFGFFAYFVAVLLNSLLKNWLNVNLSTITGA